VVEAPSGVLACSRCGSENVPIVLRGWSRLYAFFLRVRETRSSAYVCAECAEKRTAFSLAVTACCGWWALQSFFWYAPKSTYINWRAVWAPPSDPLAWGAIPLAELLDAIAPAGNEPEVEEEERAPRFSPLDRLTAIEQEQVLHAPDPYEALGIDAGATDAQVKAAWRQQAKANHPDLNPGDTGAEARMLAVNGAYEILRDPRLRAAYDWLIASGSRPG
jgi:hypothetical protein